ncbi:MAG TPA: SCP2 sterol-binding domain-containing protein [Smithella sp.]|nr:SCP2 sterol-binding domain-containing protein [Smithella sp.]
MRQWVIPQAPENIEMNDFFTQLVPNHFNRLKEFFGLIDFSFLNGSDLRMQFDIEGQIYSLRFKNGNHLDVIRGPIDEPHFTLYISEKDWRDAVTGKFHELADHFMGNPFALINAKYYEALMSTEGTVNMNLKKKDGDILPLKLIFNDEEKPAVTVNLDMLDALQLVNKSATGLGLFMNGRLKFSGSVVLLMKLQTLL